MRIKGLAILALLLQASAFASPPEEGKSIFLSRCASCHNVNKQLVGPALAGLEDRRSIEWITKFVRSSQSLIKGGDTTAIGLFKQFNNLPMPDHTDLTEGDIQSIVEYIRLEGKSVQENAAPFAKPGRKADNYRPLTIQKDYVVLLGFLIVVGMLIMALLSAVRLVDFRRKGPGTDL